MKRTTVAALLVGSVSLCLSAHAAELDGAWANDASVCNQVFTKTNNKVSFTPNSELYGGGLLIEGKRATGTFQKCNIKSIKRDGANVRVVASCSAGVMAEETEAAIKIIDKNNITISVAGPVNTETPLVRCPM
jgi:hypothetical protein